MITTMAQVAEAMEVARKLRDLRALRTKAETVCQANAFGPNGAGLTIKLSDAIVQRAKADLLKEIDAEQAAARRRLAQLGLSEEGL